MLKGIGVFIVCFVVVLGVLILLQPSPQESAMSSLVAAENVLEGVKGSEAPAKLDEARKILSDTAFLSKAQEGRDKAIASIDEAKTAIGGDQAKVNAAMAAAKTQIGQAKNNLTATTATERVKVVKDQMLALVWPVVIAILILYIFNSKSALDVLKHMGSLVSNVKVPGGLEIAFAGGAAVKNTQEEVIKGYRQQVITQYDLAATQTQISDTVERIIKERIEPFFGAHKLKRPDFRCTIHVRDILFQSSLYQLIDYLPRKWSATGKVTRGRAWSVRYGLMGRCWRLEKSEMEGSVPTSEVDLIEKWGLTKNEAGGASKKQTMLCHLILSESQNPLAIFYLDAEPRDAFGDAGQMSALLGVVKKAIEDFKLKGLLEKVSDSVQKSAPLIEIYADPR
jgi:hypothetical protein